MEKRLHPLHRYVAPACHFVEEEKRQDGRHCKNGGIRGSVPVVAADDFRVDGHGECLRAVRIQDDG